MAYATTKESLQDELDAIRAAGTWKREIIIDGPQQPALETENGAAINFCANNYLGLANHPDIVKAAAAALESHGYGMASVRFICGTQDLHRELEKRLAAFVGMEDTILYSSCFDANAGLFETLLNAGDAVLSDALNHASIIDGVRLCKAQRAVYAHNDMAQLEAKLREYSGARRRLIATDGVFSMQGDFAPLDKICDLAEKYDAMVMVDDSHATGFIGKSGRGTPELFGVTERIDILTGTLGKALGGASGGFTAARHEIVELLRQRSRPYLFSNALAPPIVAATLAALQLVTPERIAAVTENAAYFRRRLKEIGFDVLDGTHPIVPIMLGDEKSAVALARAANARGLFVVGFTFPVVPRGQARIRVQLSAAHTREQLDRALEIFEAAGKELGVIK